MHKLSKKVPRNSEVAVVEIRTNVNHAGEGFDRRALQLLNGCFTDANLKFLNVAQYSLTFTGNMRAAQIEELHELVRQGNHKVVVLLGSNALKKFVNTKKTLDDYNGSLTWSEDLETWVLPTYHPSVVYIGPKETLNKRYDQFDVLYDHVQRVGELINGKREFPPKEGHYVPWEWVGHNGEPGYLDDPQVWSGYFEATEDEVNRAVEIFSQWLGELDGET